MFSIDRVGANPTARVSASTRRNQATNVLQDAFSTILREVGRQGYASADQDAIPHAALKDASEGWDGWFNEFGVSGYSDYIGSEKFALAGGTLTQEDLAEGYKRVFTEAYEQGGYVNPKQYLSALSKEELRTVQMVQRLAEPIVVEELSDEGALNLLIPPPAHVDENQDGISQVGKANMLRFPDSNTPREVRDAWEAATANLSESERMLYTFQMVARIGLANLHVDGEGRFVRSVNPGDPDWVNPFYAPNFSFEKVAEQQIDYLDYFRNQLSPDRYTKERVFWSDFRRKVAGH